MNVDRILDTLNAREVEYLLIGGMNYLLHHEPVLTYDVDIRIRDSAENRSRCEAALAELKAEWGRSEEEWGPIADKPSGWLSRQGMYALTSAYGSIDVFRSVLGLDDWQKSASTAHNGKTASGVPYVGLSDADMLKSQLALEDGDQKRDRIRKLREAIANQECRNG